MSSRKVYSEGIFYTQSKQKDTVLLLVLYLPKNEETTRFDKEHITGPWNRGDPDWRVHR